MKSNIEIKYQSGLYIEKLINAIDTYLKIRAIAEVTREKVDSIAAEILSETEYFSQVKTRRGRTVGGERITEHKNA